MATRDTYSERTEMPTPLRLQEAKRRGQVARSSDLVSASMLLAGIGLLAWLGPRIVGQAIAMIRGILMLDGQGCAGELPTFGVILAYAGPLAGTCAMLVLALVVAAVLANVAQVGFLASAETIRADASRISPAQGLRRLFSLRSIAKGAFAAAKIAVVCVIAYATIAGSLERLFGYGAAASWPATCPPKAKPA